MNTFKLGETREMEISTFEICGSILIMNILNGSIFAGCVSGDQHLYSRAFALYSVNSAIRLREMEGRLTAHRKERQRCILFKDVYGHQTQIENRSRFTSILKSD